ncbi:uncharacterized protein LOC129761470 [Toxorhynchites rutilus septentrionalis]|uniref:uncharacterized protein LOC129761470 n=1 Tax=Toxorhynchites rutilus septentrionalis TaxID=329112 RepID=UPI00247AC21E|nr:uncharacterized protein LOC129761470 [Toxorhynchites rutilus septentrionalis]
MSEQQKLINRRKVLLSKLGRAEEFITNYNPEKDQRELPLRLEYLDSVWNGLEEVQLLLEDEETTSKGMESNKEIRFAYESLYFKIKAALQSRLPLPSTKNDSPSPISGLSGLKLPTITLPEFNGDYSQWLAFHDTFDALINTNVDVPDIQKFHYLRAAVKGEAAQLIETLAISSENYRIACQTLISRYANDYLLKKRHIQALLDCPRVKRESAEALHGVVDAYERHTKILCQLGEPVDNWSTILEHLLCMRLDDITLKAWEDYAFTVETQSFAQLTAFLHRRIRVLESMSVNHQSQHSTNSNDHFASSRRQSFQRIASHVNAETPQRKCYACHQQHPLIKCERFQRMNLPDRLSLTNNHRLCQNCFRNDHFARNCPSTYSCRRYQKRHHTLLHPGFQPAEHPHHRPSSPPPRTSTNVSCEQNARSIAQTATTSNNSAAFQSCNPVP